MKRIVICEPDRVVVLRLQQLKRDIGMMTISLKNPKLATKWQRHEETLDMILKEG